MQQPANEAALANQMSEHFAEDKDAPVLDSMDQPGESAAVDESGAAIDMSGDMEGDASPGVGRDMDGDA